MVFEEFRIIFHDEVNLTEGEGFLSNGLEAGNVKKCMSRTPSKSINICATFLLFLHSNPQNMNISNPSITHLSAIIVINPHPNLFVHIIVKSSQYFDAIIFHVSPKEDSQGEEEAT
jgi:hypothetical protein